PSPATNFWASVDYLMAWLRGTTPPALVTTSPAGTDRALAGILGPSSTTVLLGGSATNDEVRSGIRVGLGGWLSADRTFGAEAGFMMLESEATLFSASSDQFPILARPYFDVRNFSPQAVLIAFPGLATGSVDARISSANFYEAHADLTARL